MLTRSLVLCRYNEDISWISNYERDDLKIYVYDKGNLFETNQSNVTIIESNNVGRESETFIRHIVENYEKLTDHVYFSQSYPFPHIPDYCSILNEQLEKQNIDGGFFWIGTKILNNTSLDYGSEKYPVTNDHPNPYFSSMRKIYEYSFGEPCPNIKEYCVSGNFFVSKDNILKNSKEEYEKVLSFLTHEEQKSFSGFWKCNAIEAHLLEKMWGIIFN